MTIAEAIRFIKNQLSGVSKECAFFETELILQHVLQYSRSQLYLLRNNLISMELRNSINTILERRKQHEPLAYILNTVYFHSREFFVNKHVFIPRPDTEILVETVLKFEKDTHSKFFEIGIGSGVICAILLQERPHWQCIGTDISFPALHVAKQNCTGTIHFACIDIVSSIKPQSHFDFIVSNPPYISEKEMAELDVSVRDFEPKIALDGGKDGLNFYRAFASQAKNYLKPTGRVYCEIGYLQKDSVKTIFSSHGWKGINIFNDFAGRPRVLKCNR